MVSEIRNEIKEAEKIVEKYEKAVKKEAYIPKLEDVEKYEKTLKKGEIHKRKLGGLPNFIKEWNKSGKNAADLVEFYSKRSNVASNNPLSRYQNAIISFSTYKKLIDNPDFIKKSLNQTVFYNKNDPNSSGFATYLEPLKQTFCNLSYALYYLRTNLEGPNKEEKEIYLKSIKRLGDVALMELGKIMKNEYKELDKRVNPEVHKDELNLLINNAKNYLREADLQ